MGEIGRRLVHAAGVGIPGLYLLDFVTWGELRMVLVLGSVIAIVLEVLRLRVGLDWWIYENLTRPYESDAIAGYALYMVSITVVGLAFQPTVAIPAMLMLMLGDPVSGYVGSGTLRNVKRPVSMAAMFLVSLAVALPFTLGVIGEPMWAVLAAAVTAGMATIADGVKPVVRGFVVDDNLTIPIAGALTLWIGYRLLPPAI